MAPPSLSAPSATFTAAASARAGRFLFTGRHVLAKCGTLVAKRQPTKTGVVNKMDKGGALTAAGIDPPKKSYQAPLQKANRPLLKQIGLQGERSMNKVRPRAHEFK